MNKKEIESFYKAVLKNAAKYYHEYGVGDTMYNYFEGKVHGYSDVLGYEFNTIEADIKDAIPRCSKYN